jgi:hypothetical protein
MSGFEWHLDDGEGWVDRRPLPRRKTHQPKWRKVAYLIAIALSLVAAGTPAVRRLQRSLSDLDLNLQAEIQATHALALDAAIRGDEELLRSLLSGRSSRWTSTQLRMMRQSSFFDRPAFDLQASTEASDAREASESDIKLSPDRRAAVVTYLQTYSTDAGNGSASIVTLSQTLSYRRGERGWLLSAPDAGFWGERRTSSGKHLTMSYPERDSEIAERLIGDIDDKLNEMCLVLPDINCPVQLDLDLALTDDSTSLLSSADLDTVVQSDLSLRLPTPTLIGLPLDETGYQALLRGYASNIMAAVTARLVGYECCQHGAFFRALLDKQRARLNLLRWPLQQSEYDQLSLRQFRWTNLYWHWDSSTLALPEDWQQLYSLVDFLLDEAAPGTSISHMQRELSQSHGRYLSWMRSFGDIGRDTGRFTDDWVRFVHDQTTSRTQSVAPVPFPEQGLLLTCHSSTGKGVSLYRYDLLNDQWNIEVERGDVFGFINRLSSGDYIVHERNLDSAEPASRTTLWGVGKEILFSKDVGDASSKELDLYFAGEDPTGRFVLLLTPGNPGESNQYFIVDLDHCLPNECEVQPLPDRPNWSPTGAQTLINPIGPDGMDLVAEPRSPWRQLLYVGDEQARSLSPIGVGLEAFWLDDSNYGFLRLNAGSANRAPEPELVATAPDSDQIHVLLRSSDLLPFVPVADRPDHLFMHSVEAGSGTRNTLVVAASATAEWKNAPGFLFLIELDRRRMITSGIKLLSHVDRPPTLALSPDGLWLAVSGDGSRGNFVHLYDLETGKVTTIDSAGSWAGWSADGNWLAQRYEGYLSLYAPAWEFQHLVFRDLSDCRSARWAED